MNKATEFRSGNFSFLSEHDALFVELAEAAERAFASDLYTTYRHVPQRKGVFRCKM